METGNKMWSYRMTYDYMFAPNPFFEILTLATCKPMIRRNKNNKPGMWIAGWTACTVHNAPVWGRKDDHYRRNEERLIYLAQIEEILPLDVYYQKYPEKRSVFSAPEISPYYYGDNIYTSYHKNENGEIIALDNHGDHYGPEIAKTDYYKGKNALICKKFFYFTPDKRLDIPDRFKVLVHPGIGQSLKDGSLIDEFIEYVTAEAKKEGKDNGIVGEMPFIVDGHSTLSDNYKDNSKNKKGCSKRKGCAK